MSLSLKLMMEDSMMILTSASFLSLHVACLRARACKINFMAPLGVVSTVEKCMMVHHPEALSS
jgi:hypothetical protein